MKKYKLVPAFLSAAMAFQMIPSASLPVMAQGTSSENLTVSQQAKQDTQAAKFTGKEWSGTTYTDLDHNQVSAEKVFKINTEQASAQIIDYQSQQAAIDSVWNFDARKDSSYMQMLTGAGAENQWDLTVVENPAAAEKFLGENGFMQADYAMQEEDGWKSVTLPCSWTMQGFDYSLYTNQNMPWQGSEAFYRGSTSANSTVYPPLAPTKYNPVGLYRRSFTVDEALRQDNRRIYITFNGVESAYYLYVNGMEVGYSEDSFSPHKFDITDYLQDGENFLAVKVHKFCDGTWFEDQDMIYDGGIFRDVFLTSAPLVQIRDYFVTTDLNDAFNAADLNVALELSNLSSSDAEGWSIEAQAFDRNGNQILHNASLAVDELKAGSKGSWNLNTHVENPLLWSAENPNLYALVLTLKDGSGKEVQRVSAQLGFREIGFTRTPRSGSAGVIYDPVTINGQPLLFKGTDRHDTDPLYGKYVPEATVKEDLRLMKTHNLNAIRTSHYSNDDYLYWLSNEWGIYVLAETNAECHALFAESYNEDKAKFKEAVMDRQETAFERLKNNPAVVMWSIGNEIGYPANPNAADSMFNDAVWYFKDRDATRPVHCESLSAANGFGVDVDSSMYGSQSYAAGKHRAGNIPYMQCEYAHAMGNSVGGLKEYMEAYRLGDNMLGGFIWDWVDQTRAKEMDAIRSYSLRDATGVAGTLNGSETSWNRNAGEKTWNGGVSFSGYTEMDNDPKYNQALSGSGKSFTYEVMVKPTANSSDNIFIAKGDYQVSLKTNKSSQLEFFVYGSSWSSITAPLPSDWVDNWHQVAAVYDKGSAKLYIDGQQVAASSISSTITPQENKLAVGYDSTNNRRLQGEISLARIYTRALSAEELAGQASLTPAISREDDSVLLWVDYASNVTETVETGWDYYASDNAQGGIYTEEMKGRFHSYGGDWGDSPNDNSFCENGLISGDRQAQPELEEVKYQYQNLWFDASVNQLDAGVVSVYNENSFTDLSEYDLTWQVVEDGFVIKEGSFTASCAPRTAEEIQVPFVMPAQLKDGAEYYLNLSARLKEDTGWADAGYELSWKQIALPAAAGKARQAVKMASSYEEQDEVFRVSGPDFSFDIDKNTGCMLEYQYKGQTLLEKGPQPNFWRARVENDVNDTGAYSTTWRHAAENIEVESIEASTNEAGQAVITAHIVFPDAGSTRETITYTINGDGAVSVALSVDASQSGMGGFIRVGSMMTLPEGFEDVSWYGNGPVETFSDRAANGRQGVYSSTVSDLFYPYIKVDDTGNMTDVKWISVKNAETGQAVLVAAKEKSEASALHFTAEELDSVNHPYELSPDAQTYLSLDYGSKGTGTATCGPGVLDAYKLPSSQIYEWEYTIIPASASDSTAVLSEKAKGYRNTETFDRDSYDRQAADEMIKTIDSFAAYDYSQLSDIEALKTEYSRMTPSQKTMVNEGKDRAALLDALEAQIRSFEGQTAYVQDHSSSALEVPYASSARFIKKGDALNMRGDLGAASSVLDDLFAGTNSWTVEVTLTPTGADGQKYIAGKGDYNFALRTQSVGGTIGFSFHISNGSSWYAYTVALPQNKADTWLNNEHTVAAVRDGQNGTLAIYVDGDLIGSHTIGTVSMARSSYHFTIGKCPSENRTGDADFARAVVYSKALSASEAAAQYQNSETAIQPEDDCVALWLDFTRVLHKDAVPVSEAFLTPAAGTIEAGQSASFTLGVNEGAIVRSADWSFEGDVLEGISIEGIGAEAVVSTDASIADERTVTIKAENINGLQNLSASAQLTITPKEVIETAIKDLSANGLHTLLPQTAELTEGENGLANGAVKGWFAVNDEQHIINAAIESGNPFTVSTRVYIPQDALSEDTGLWSGSTKYNMIASLGDYTFAMRFHTTKAGRRALVSHIYNGTGWEETSTENITDEAFYNAWHNVTAVYSGSSLALYLDGEKAAETELETPNSIGASSCTFHIGCEPSAISSRQSELPISRVKIFAGSISASQADAADDPKADGVVYWMELDRQETPAAKGDNRLLELAVQYALQAKEEDSYSTVHPIVKEKFESALQAAQAVLADSSADQKTIDAAWMALSEAIHYLSFTSDKTLLAELISRAEEIAADLDRYEGDTQTFMQALEAAREVMNNPTALDDSIAQALADLAAAIDGVHLKSDADLSLEILRMLVQVGLDTDLTLYVEAGQAEFIEALGHGQEILADPQSQDEVDQAAMQLHEAYLNLRLKADESLLQSLKDFMVEIRNADAALYSPEDYEELQVIYKELITAFERHEQKDPEIDQQAAARLESRMVRGKELLGRIHTSAISKTALAALLRDAAGKSAADYTAASWNAYQDALKQAQTVFEDEQAVQSSIDAAASALEAAASKLERKPAAFANQSNASAAASDQKTAAVSKSVSTAASTQKGFFAAVFAAAAAAGAVLLRKRRK